MTKAASSITQTTATLNATVNPNGGEVSEMRIRIRHDDLLRLERAVRLAAGVRRPARLRCPRAITGLAANTTYHFRISATNAGGTSKGADETFKTLPNAPTVVTDSGLGDHADHGDPERDRQPQRRGSQRNANSNTARRTSYGSSAPCASLPGSGTSPVAVSAALTGLTANTTYHFRISATNAGGTSTGSDQAFTTVPARHYYRNNLLVGSEPRTVIEWGTLALQTVAGGSGEVVCHTVQAGTIDNPAGGGPGVGSTQLYAAYDCESTTCPYDSVVTAQSLPWSSVLASEGSVVRAITTGVNIKTDCQKNGVSQGSVTFVGADQPSFLKGTMALHPGRLKFGAGSGTLEAEGSAGSILARTEGEVKILGFDEQDLIGVK